MLLLWAQQTSTPRAANEWTGTRLNVTTGTFVPTVPTLPEVEPWEAPEIIDTTRPKMVQFAVSSIRDFQWLGEANKGRMDGMRSLRLDGGGDMTFSMPTTDPSVLLFTDDIETWGDLTTGRVKVIDRAIHPVIDGQLAPAYVPRGEGTVKGGVFTLPCQAPTRLFQDRIVGQGKRKDYLNGRGHFPGNASYGALSFVWTGNPGDIRFFDHGVTGGRSLAIRGNSQTARLFVDVVINEPEGTTNQQVTVRSSAFLNVPEDATNETTLMQTSVFVGGVRYSPTLGQPFPADLTARVTEDTPRGEFSRDPYTSAALLPAPPYTALVRTEWFPKDPVEWLEISNVEIFRRDTLSTGVPRDLVDHQLILIREMQSTAKGKSSWSLPVVRGASSGVSEVGVWRAEDEQPMVEALAAIDSRDDGPDPPWVIAGWKVQVGHRRGQVRPDLRLGPDEILSSDGWSHDAGAMKSQVRGVTDRGAGYWRVNHVETDTSRTDGHVIEVQVRLPNDMELLELAEATRARLVQLAQPQETTRLVVPGWLARKVACGDSFRVVQVDGFLRLDRLMRVDQWAMDDEADIGVLDMGNDERPD